jgi:hypothetical protein
VELILVVFALFVLAIPVATIILFVRLRAVRQQLLKVTSLSVEVTDGLRRDLQELQRKVDALTHAGTPSTEATPVRSLSRLRGPAPREKNRRNPPRRR